MTDLTKLSDEELLASIGKAAPKPSQGSELSAISDAELLASLGPNVRTAGFATRAQRGEDAITQGEAFRTGFSQGATFGMYDEGAALAAAGEPKFADAGQPMTEAERQAKDLFEDSPSVGPLEKIGAGIRDVAIRGTQPATDAYNKALAQERGAIADAEKQYPGTALAGNILGGVVVPLPAAQSAKGMAAVGAGAGALFGFGSGEGVTDRLTQAATGGAVGGALGAATPYIVNGIANIGSGVRSVVGTAMSPVTGTAKGLIAPQREAERRVAAAFARDGIADPAAELARLQAVADPAIAADAGGGTIRALARSATDQSPEARDLLSNAVSDRFAAQGERIIDTLRGTAASTGADALEALQGAARKANKAAYDVAHQEAEKIGGMWTSRLSELAQAPATQEAFKDAIRSGGNKVVVDGMPPIRTPFGVDDAGNLVLKRQKDGSVAVPNLAFWDATQRSLRDMAESAARQGKKELATDIGNLRREILKEVDTVVPAFNEARTGAARFFQAEDALEAGKSFVTSRMENREALKALAKMKPAERELFAEGFRESIISKVREIGDSRDVVKAMFNSPASRERVKIALGEAKAKELEAVLKVESAMMAVQTILGGSQTSRFLPQLGLAAAGASAGGGLGYLTGGGDGSMIGAALGALARPGMALAGNKVAQQIGEILATSDPAKLQAITKAAAKNKATMQAIEAITDAVSGLAAKASGTQAAPLGETIGNNVIPMITGPMRSAAGSNGQPQPEEQRAR